MVSANPTEGDVKEAESGGDTVRTSTKKGATSQASTRDEVSRYVLTLFQDQLYQPARHSSINQGLVMDLRRKIEDSIDTPRDMVEIDVWLESPGGDAHAAYKLAQLLRAYASTIRVVVPDFAKSAATLLALVADEIYMAPAAELGPLDAQIPNEGGVISTISALDIARSLEDLTATAMGLALQGGAEVLQITSLSRAESLSTMLDFSAKFMEPIVAQLDPRMIHWASTLLDVSVAYGTRLLVSRDGAGPHPEASSIPRSLVEDYPTHGFVISREEAADKLGLPAFPLRDYDFTKEVSALHRRYEDSRVNAVELLSTSELRLDKDGGE